MKLTAHKLAISLIILFLVGCSFQTISEPRRPDADNEPTPVPTAASVEKPSYIVERGDVNSQLIISGRVIPQKQSRLTFTSSGQIAEVLIAQNDQVTEGDIVARLDQSDLIGELEAAEARLNLIETQLNEALAQAELNRV